METHHGSKKKTQKVMEEALHETEQKTSHHRYPGELKQEFDFIDILAILLIGFCIATIFFSLLGRAKSKPRK